MGAQKRLSGQEAVEQFKEVVDHQGLCMMVTRVDEHPSHSRPMSVGQVDDQGNFWMLTLAGTHKMDDIQRDPRCYLYFINPGKQEFLSVMGTVEVLNDQQKKEELWSPFAKAWVPGGVEDPDLRALKVTPVDGYYWDTKAGVLVAGMKIAVAALTGARTSDGGVEGRVKP
ncbi:MAG: pyridoxamine 5'-phosphate oxidase family protein [Flavobacteriales bacterium]|jgi:general stress protein 26|nr:pyridoxamine 5'-phosphate oxidase family protein [Flavobacteriales bacterium]